jgi:hypothetical protein
MTQGRASTTHATSAASRPAWISQIRAEWQANPRLRIGVMTIVAMAIVMSLLRLDEARQAMRTDAGRLATENARLTRMLNSGKQQQAAARLVLLQEQIARRLWQVPSTTVAQAELGTWLTDELTAAGAKEVLVAQATLKGQAPSTAEKQEPTSAATSAPPADCQKAACQLVELRTTIRFTFDAAVLPKALERLESSDKPLTIEQLTIHATERRVEMSVKVLASVVPAAGAAATTPPVAAAADTTATPPSAATTPSATAAANAPVSPPKIVEVKW